MAARAGTPLARRTAIGFVTLALAGFTGVALAGTAHADPVPTLAIVDKHSPSGGHGGGGHGSPPPSPKPTDTPAPTPEPTGPGASDPLGSGPTSPAPPEEPPAGAPGSPAAQPAGAGPASAGDSGSGATIIGRRLGTGSQLAAAHPSGSSGSGHSGARPERANGLGATDSIRLAGTAVPLWLVVGGGALVVLLVAIGLTLTLRDRDKGIEPEDVSTPELPTGVKFG